MAEKKEEKSKALGIYAKLLEFQKLEVSIKPDSTNPAFKSKYADINEVLAKVRPALSSVGITLIQIPSDVGIKTVLYDPETDTSIEGFLPYIEMGTSQKLGSSITYNRRYSLVAMLGLEDEDDDGNAAVAPSKTPTRTAEPKAPTMSIDQVFAVLRTSLNVNDLTEKFKALPPIYKKDTEVIALCTELKAALTV